MTDGAVLLSPGMWSSDPPPRTPPPRKEVPPGKQLHQQQKAQATTAEGTVTACWGRPEHCGQLGQHAAGRSALQGLHRHGSHV